MGRDGRLEEPAIPGVSRLEMLAMMAGVDYLELKAWLVAEIERRRHEQAAADAELHAMEDRPREQLDARLDRLAEQNGTGAVAASGDGPETSPGPHQHSI